MEHPDYEDDETVLEEITRIDFSYEIDDPLKFKAICISHRGWYMRTGATDVPSSVANSRFPSSLFPVRGLPFHHSQGWRKSTDAQVMRYRQECADHHYKERMMDPKGRWRVPELWKDGQLELVSASYYLELKYIPKDEFSSFID